jgi:hypothetical protein
MLDASDVALHVCDRSDKILGQVLVNQDEAWTAPVGRSLAESGWRRRLAQQPLNPAGANLAGTTHPGWLTGPVPALVAAQLALSCFRHFTGLDEPPLPDGRSARPALTRVDRRRG